MDKIRRILLKGAGASAALAAAVAAGVLRPTQVLAAEWNKTAFSASDLAGAMKGIGATSPPDSADIVLKAPEIAENGAVVPIDITSNIPNTRELAVFVEKNPFPLASSFTFANGAQPSMHVRLKMAQTSNIKVVAKADGKYFSTTKEVKVTVGGCDG